MKIAVTSRGDTLDALVDPRFGRAAYILFVDSETLDFEAMDNKANINALKGAGIQAATMVSGKGAEVLLTGYCGPNAMKTLNAAKVKVAAEIEGTVKDVIVNYMAGKYQHTDTANVEGQW